MSIEIRQMLIKSQVVQRTAADDDTGAAAVQPAPPGEHDWRAECRRLIGEVLDERKER